VTIKGVIVARNNDPFEFIKGEDIFTIVGEGRVSLVENILHKKDYVLFSAEQKTGKTVFLQQLAMSMSVGKPFMDVFAVPKPLKVAYIATEGKLEDLQDRFIRMREKVDYDPDNLLLIKSKCKFNGKGAEAYMQFLVAYMEGLDFHPDVIIIDPIYNAIIGSLTNDDVVNQFNTCVFSLMNHFDCSVMAAHHLKKVLKDANGKEFSRSDNDVFGSMFLSAAVDHVFRLEKYKKGGPKDLILHCDTQRSGDIIEKFRMKMIEPNPLYLKYMDVNIENKNKLIKVIQSSSTGLSAPDIIERSKMSKSSVYPLLTLMTGDQLDKEYRDRKPYYSVRNYISDNGQAS
jgi:hypothetical protein